MSKWYYLFNFNFTYSNFYFNHIDITNFKQSSFALQSNFNFYDNFIKNPPLFFDTENFLTNYEDEDLFLEEESFIDYINIRKFSFISFFIDNLIDIPICFRKSKSLKNKNFELFFLKFSNLAMKKGKKEKIFRIILKSFFFFTEESEKNLKLNNIFSFNFFDLIIFLNNKIKPYNNKNIFLNFFLEENKGIELKNNNLLFLQEKEFDSNFFIKNFINNKLSQLSPLFIYYIYSVDKNIRKYTRGKSGKYLFIWKYVASYKRKNIMLRWFLKDVKFDESKKINDRFFNLFSKLSFNLNSTLAWKAKNYTYAFIFKNFRKTLMMNLKTLTK